MRQTRKVFPTDAARYNSGGLPVGYKDASHYVDPMHPATWTRGGERQDCAVFAAPGIIGIDVDHYDDKRGGDTLEGLEAEYGKLPGTYSSTSRGDGPSRIYWFRTPPVDGASERNVFATKFDSIEVIQSHHRFGAVYPTVSGKTGELYRWFDKRGTVMPESEIPRVDDLAELPPSWVDMLQGARTSLSLARVESPAEVRLTDGDPCSLVFAPLRNYDVAVSNGQAHHDAMVTATQALAFCAVEGHRGSQSVVDQLRDVFVAYTETVGRDGASEFDSALASAFTKIPATHKSQSRCRECDGVGPATRLPESFWDQRDYLKHIHTAAMSVSMSPDSVLHAVLAKVSACLQPGWKVDTGFKLPCAVNYFHAVVAPSGSGKSTLMNLIADLVPDSPFIDAEVSGLPVGSGEGIVASYFTKKQMLEGEGSSKKVTRMVKSRDNAFLDIDEGDQLIAIMQRNGSVLTETIRSAWSGRVVGQANAGDETRRILPRNSYSLGMVVGFQRERVQPLLDGSCGGTPQRFTFSDPRLHGDSMEREIPAFPGALDINWNWGSALDGRRTFKVTDPSVSRELRELEVAVNNGAVIAELDSQRGAMIARIAGLMVYLDQRTDITRDDWDLAVTVYDTSAALRDEMVGEGAQRMRAQAEAQDERFINRQVAASAAVRNIDATERRIQQWCIAKLSELGPSTAGEIRRKAAGRDRGMIQSTLDGLVMSEVLTLNDSKYQLADAGDLAA